MENDIQKYIRCMEEIKLRDEVVEGVLKGVCTTGQPMINIELICLQFRKICELIMLAALCAHKITYQDVLNKLEKEWDANIIQKELEKIHPDFYPVPFDRINDMGKVRNELVKNGFLSKSECIALIGRCGGILHAFNPYNDKKVFQNVEKVKKDFSEWQKKIRRLLATHQIKLVGTDKQLWVYMVHDSKNKVLVEERVPVRMG